MEIGNEESGLSDELEQKTKQSTEGTEAQRRTGEED
jgi:hypothetical protein